jgi:hypothetical protein
MSAAPTERLHPVARAVAEAASALREATEVPLFGLGDSELRDLCRQVTSLASALAAVEGAVLAQAETRDVGAEVGATSTASWLAPETRLTRVEAHRRVRLARDLEELPATAGALADGRVVSEQAPVICDALAQLDAIPADLVADRVLDLPALRTHAEQHLLAEAAHHDAKGLRILGRHLLDVVAPEVAEEHERRLLEQEEERTRQMTRLTMTEDGRGCVHGRFTLPALQAAMLKKALLALAAPKHQTAVEGPAPVSGRPSAERMGQAFAEYVERYPADRIPAAGGVRATVVITMDLARLQQGLGAGVLDDGGRISATLVRRLACEAGIIPAVLGGKGQPLDVGRKKRFHTTAQRIALAIRDGGCTAEGCDHPPGLCHAHHDISWSRDGSTNVVDGRLLCPRHHALARNPHYLTTRLGTGKLRFTRRT